MTEQITFFNYWRELYQEASPETRRRWRIALAVYLGLLLVGSFLAATQITAVAMTDDLGKPLAALAVGPLGVFWVMLELTGFIVENPADPGLGWLLPAVLHVGLGVGILLLGFQPVNPQTLQKRDLSKHQQSQGQLTSEEAAEKLPLKMGIPLVWVKNQDKKLVKAGIDIRTGQGHVLVTAPTRSGKGLHLTEVLTMWPGPAVVIDPKSEQYERTAGFRSQHLGPVYHLPGHGISLASRYNFCNRDDIQELHDQMLRPEEDMQRIFADKSLALFLAIGHFAKAKKLNPMRVLLDAAEDNLHQVLAGLYSVPAARPFVRQFTNGQPPDKATSADRFLSSAYGTFTTRLFGYQKHIDTICPRSGMDTLPWYWAMERATLYITYNLNELEGVGGVVAAILAGLMREHMRSGQKQRLLVAVDEMAAVRLRHLDTYLATVGGYGITMLLYAQSLAQLTGIYRQAGAESILSNCAHQLWYPPNEIHTARYISKLYGTTLKPARTYSTGSQTIRQENGQMRTIPQQRVNETLVEEDAYTPTQVLACDRETVFVFTEQGQQYRFIGQRLDPREAFAQLPPPPAVPKLPAGPRRYTDWLQETETPPAAQGTNGRSSETEKTETGRTAGDTQAAAAALPETRNEPAEQAEPANDTAENDGPAKTDSDETTTGYKPDDKTLM